MSAPRWEPPNAKLQIGGSPATDIFAMLPKKTATAIQESPQMKLMAGHQAGRQGLAGASHSDINGFLMNQGFIEKPVTSPRGVENPFSPWINETRSLAMQKELSQEDLTYFTSYNDGEKTTPSAPNNDELKIA